MLDVLLEEEYFDCLYDSMVGGITLPAGEEFYKLFKQLYTSRFYWIVPGDENRAEDGVDLRKQFISARKVDPVVPGWTEEACSILEMLVAFSDIAEFETDEKASEWFWIFLDNLDLSGMHDGAFDELKFEEIIYRFVSRDYKYNGQGGLFPLEHPTKDQREVEIWYQFCAYISELSIFERD
jgi:hypothetical protein